MYIKCKCGNEIKVTGEEAIDFARGSDEMIIEYIIESCQECMDTAFESGYFTGLAENS